MNATFDTFSGNTAAQGGTDVYVLSDASNGGNNTSQGSGMAMATLVNDILGQSNTSVADFIANTNAGGAAPNLSGSSNDIVSNNSPTTGNGLTGNGVTNITTANPDLHALASFGGPTQTMALFSGSPAIGAGATGTGITTDQRGASPATLPASGPPSMFLFRHTTFTT